MFHSFVQCFYCPWWLQFNWKWTVLTRFHQREYRHSTLWSLNWTKECKDVLGGVTWGILKNQTNFQPQSPSSCFRGWGCIGWFITSRIVVRVTGAGFIQCHKYDCRRDLNILSCEPSAVKLQKESFCTWKPLHNPPGKSGPQSSMWRKIWWMLCYLSVF